MKTRKILISVGARPNFMKAAALLGALRKYPEFIPILIHTGQHYDNGMSDTFLKELDLPRPSIYLGVGSGTHAEQTGKIMIAFEKICLSTKPDLVIVVGDVNSTISCALAAAKLCLPVAHVEAGLRSFDRTMPEEINRIITDQVSDLLFTSCEDANLNLIKEGIPEDKIYFVGNVMIDTLKKHIGAAGQSKILKSLALKKNGKIKKYLVLTLHRPPNVDASTILTGIIGALLELPPDAPVIFPIHPRTLKQLREFNLIKKMTYTEDISIGKINDKCSSIIGTPPLGYLDFLCLISQASLVLTDSGGIQEETTFLGVPCLTLRNSTERPITIKEGTNLLIGNDPDRIKNITMRVMKRGIPRKKVPKYWDGRASERIVEILKNRY
jgi:UDP-N-acetylglucosamine 2-epimerase (non-hydrolysing)